MLISRLFFDSATDRSGGAWLARENSAHTTVYNRIVLFKMSDSVIWHVLSFWHSKSQTAFHRKAVKIASEEWINFWEEVTKPHCWTSSDTFALSGRSQHPFITRGSVWHTTVHIVKQKNSVNNCHHASIIKHTVCSSRNINLVWEILLCFRDLDWLGPDWSQACDAITLCNQLWHIRYGPELVWVCCCHVVHCYSQT